MLAEVRKHSGRTTFRVRLDQSGSQLLSLLGRARTPLFYERDGYHTSPGIKYCCRKCFLLAEVRKHSGRTAFRVRLDQSGSQLLSVLGRAARAAPLSSMKLSPDSRRPGPRGQRAARRCVSPGRSRVSANNGQGCQTTYVPLRCRLGWKSDDGLRDHFSSGPPITSHQ